MGVIVSSLISADGFRDRPMSWIGDLFDADSVEASILQLKSADAFLMGRGSYEAFAPMWGNGGDPYADALGGHAEVRLLLDAGRHDVGQHHDRADRRGRGGPGPARHQPAVRLRPAGAVAARGRAGGRAALRRAPGHGRAGPDAAAAAGRGPAANGAVALRYAPS